MDLPIAGLLLYVATSCVASGLLFLPAAALAESLPRRCAVWGTRLWFAALLLPHVLAAAALGYALRMHALDPVPWSARAPTFRHLSFWWITDSPDAAYRIEVIALAAVAAVLVGMLRPFFSVALSWRYARVLAGVSTEVPELRVWLTPLDRPWSACLGLLRQRVYITSGLAKLLDPEELSAVIAHEQAHARRRDNLRQLLAQAAFGPTVAMPTAHLCLRRLQASIERAADHEAAREETDGQALASALVKAARKLRDLSADPNEEPLRRRLANRYREEFVAERAQLLLDTGEGEGHSVGRRLALLLPAALLLALAGIGAPLAAPTVRSFFESLLEALSANR
ncbi:MAG: M56 family metallopeptidase [Armatimonadetes bacterium]|nr:M56 family metallopeptidase [Armatimonadota bacterium]